MKKSIVVLLLLSISLFCWGEEFESAIELQLEQELSNRIERVLEPFLGHCVATVDLDLRYPSFLKALSQIGDTEEFVEETNVARSKAAILSQQRKKYEQEQTLVLSKKVTIFIHEKIDEKMDIFIKQNIENLLQFDSKKGDVLLIKRILPPTEEKKSISTSKEDASEDIKKAVKTERKSTFSEGLNNVIFLLIFVLMIIFIIMFRASISKVLNTRTNVNVTGFDKLIRLQSGNKSTTVSGSSRKTISSPNEPVFVQMVTNKEEKEVDDSLDFSYLESLSIQQFIEIIQAEKSTEIASILGNLSDDYVRKFFENFQKPSGAILKELISQSQKSKTEIENLQKKYNKKYKEQLIKARLTYNGTETLIKVINHSSPEQSRRLIEDLKQVDAKIAEEIRKRVFLMEDILILEEDDIESIITGTNHDLFVEFLMCSGDEIKQKFFKNMSPRAISIIEEDMELHSEISAEEKRTYCNRNVKFNTKFNEL